MPLIVYNIEESEKWDAIVQSFKQYDVYWLSSYVKAFQIHGDGTPLLLYYEDQTTRGVNVVMRRDIAEDANFSGVIPPNTYFDLATPYGYGGWILEGNNTSGLFQSYEAWTKNNNIICEFTRFHPLIRNHDACKSAYEVVKLGDVVHMDLGKKDDIWLNLTSKNRNMIRKAIKNDIKIYNGRYPDIYKKFKSLYDDTMDKDNANKYYYFNEDFYDSILYDLSENAQVFWAEKDGEIIAASIILTANGYMNYHLSGNRRDYYTYAPTNYLLYKVAMWGHANGYRTLYLGGGVGSECDNLFKFKRAFYTGNLNSFYIGKKIFNKELYDKLLSLRGGANNNNYFPLYRG